MADPVQGLLWVHIASGFAAFFCAPVALLTAKGGATHRRFGKYYFWLMALVAATGLVVALFRPIFFLALIAVFSFYFSFRGYRVLKHKRGGAGVVDWLFALAMLATGLAFLFLGAREPAGWRLPSPSIAIFFGLLGIYTAGSDLWQFLRPSSDRNHWWYAHMNGMLASYIAAVSAFSAVNLRFLPMPWRWLWPSIVGGIGIFFWIAYYKAKFRERKQPVRA